MRLLEFDKGWWNCFNSFANNTLSDNDSVCMEVLRGAGVTKEEVLHVLNKKDLLYGNAIDIVENFLKTLE